MEFLLKWSNTHKKIHRCVIHYDLKHRKVSHTKLAGTSMSDGQQQMQALMSRKGTMGHTESYINTCF